MTNQYADAAAQAEGNQPEVGTSAEELKAMAVAASDARLAEAKAEVAAMQAEHDALVSGTKPAAAYEPIDFSPGEDAHFKAWLRQNLEWMVREEDYHRMGQPEAQRAALNP